MPARDVSVGTRRAVPLRPRVKTLGYVRFVPPGRPVFPVPEGQPIIAP
ncbi:hypothetical protein H206_05589 [Candidatus Electrothrix aarhusensis]|uniref:Uncharacterized protein n=1 Tax=Candidatus Electrothrix aarhusensis TaxID=1859131 RepID=A0A444J403_9BACT|nr:hypothetical protein H206_05589 [Candidatus Electrothrix aarhusensis]